VMTRQERQARIVTTEFLLLIDVMTFFFSALQIHGGVRFVVVMIFSLTVPGWSVVGFLQIRDVAWLVSLSVATSMALEMVLGEIMLARWWHLGIFEMLLAAVCAGALLWQIRRTRPKSKASSR